MNATVDMVPTALQASHVYQFNLSPRMRQMLDRFSSFRSETRDSHSSCQLFQIFNKVRGSICNAASGQTVLQITTHGVRLDQHHSTSYLTYSKMSEQNFIVILTLPDEPTIRGQSTRSMPEYSPQGSSSGRNMRNTKKTRSIGHLRQHILRHLSDGMNSGNRSSRDPVNPKMLPREDPVFATLDSCRCWASNIRAKSDRYSLLRFLTRKQCEFS